MATVSSNASCNPSTISVRGKATSSGTISWSMPSLPSGVIVTSRTLTGKSSSFTTGNKGATLTVNGTSVGSNSNFTIDLGATSNVTSVSVSFIGQHNQSNASVSFSNLVYTVTYSLVYTVTFVDWDGTVLKTETVKEGSSATAPNNPTRTGYKFTGWDVSFSNITSDLTVTAQYVETEQIKIAEYIFNNALYDLIPEFNAEFTDYTYEDIVDGKVTTRTIYSNSLPTKIQFGTSSTTEPTTNFTKAVIEIIYLDIRNITNMQSMFRNCDSLKSINCSDWDISNVTNLHSTFAGCKSLTSLDVSNFDTSNVTDMNWTFMDDIGLTALDVSNFDTSKVTNMAYMFYNCDKLTSLDVSNFDTSNVTDMQSMFNNCKMLTSLDASSFNTSKVTDMQNMFQNCESLTSLNLNNFDVGKVEYMKYLFYNCSKLNNIIMNNSDYNSVNKVIIELPTRTSDSMGTLYVVGVDDYSQVDTATAQSKFWNVVEESIEPEEDVIEWTGIGTIATGLRAHAGDDGYSHDSYKINLDWENESFDMIIVDELGRNSSYSYNIGTIGDIKIGDTKLSILFSDGTISIYSNNTNNALDYYNTDYGNFPFVISFTKKGIYVKSSANTGEYSTPELLSGSENIYEINRPIYLIDDGLIYPSVSNQENPKYDILFDLVVSEYLEQSVEPEEPDNNELIQGDINEDGTFNDESTTVVRTKYIDISDKKSIQVTVLTDNVYISACYLYNANKELVKVIEIPADKKRKFGINLQELIAQIIKDEGGDQ